MLKSPAPLEINSTWLCNQTSWMANIEIYLQVKNEQSIVLPNVIISCLWEGTRKTCVEPIQSILGRSSAETWESKQKRRKSGVRGKLLFKGLPVPHGHSLLF